MNEKKKVLLYGYGDIYQKNKYWIPTIYDIVGIVDRAFECSDKVNNLYTITDGMQLSFDFILITSSYVDEIKGLLIERFHIPNEKILFFLDEFLNERKISFGEKNEGITFWVLRAHWQEKSNGFYNFFNRAVRAYHYAKKMNYELVIDMKNYYTEYATLENYGHMNVWEQYYKQPSAYSLEEVYQSKNVILSRFGNEWDSERIGDIFIPNLKNYVPFLKLGQLYAHFFTPNKKLTREINDERQRIGIGEKKVLGVLMRGTDFNRCPKAHPILHDTEKVINDIYSEIETKKYDSIYLATEDSNILEYFEKEFGSKLVYTNQCRTDRCDTLLMNISFGRKNDGYLRGLEYCTVIEILSLCDSIIANCLCGGTMAAITKNAGKYDDIIVYDDGFY